MDIAFKEVKEIRYWLGMMVDAELILKKEAFTRLAGVCKNYKNFVNHNLQKFKKKERAYLIF